MELELFKQNNGQIAKQHMVKQIAKQHAYNYVYIHTYINQGRIQDFQLGGANLNKLRRAEGGAKIVGVFRVKNHDFTPKNHMFSYFRGEGGRAGCAPPWIRPCKP